MQDLLLIENFVLQMLVYEFMPNGTLRDHLSGKRQVLTHLSFSSFFSPDIAMSFHISTYCSRTI